MFNEINLVAKGFKKTIVLNETCVFLRVFHKKVAQAGFLS